MINTVEIMAEEFKMAQPLTYDAIYNKGKADGKSEVIEEVIKKLAENDDTILSDKQYYTLMELKEQKGNKNEWR